MDQDQFLTILSREEALARFEAALVSEGGSGRAAAACRCARLHAGAGYRGADRRAAVRSLQCRRLCGALRRSRFRRRGHAGAGQAERRGHRLRHRADAAGAVGHGDLHCDRRPAAARRRRRRHGRAYPARRGARDRDPPRRFARAIRLLCRLRYRARRGVAARRHRDRLARDRHVRGLRDRGSFRRAPAARRRDLHRRRTGAARPAAGASRNLRHQWRDRHGGGEREWRRGDISRRHCRRRSKARSRDARRACDQRHAGAVRRHLEGRGRSSPTASSPGSASPASSPMAWR